MEKTANTRKYKVPQDIVMDILRVLIRNKAQYQITGIKEQENSLFLAVNYASVDRAAEVRENIEAILEEYLEYMKGIISDKTLCLDEDIEDQF